MRGEVRWASLPRKLLRFRVLAGGWPAERASVQLSLLEPLSELRGEEVKEKLQRCLEGVEWGGVEPTFEVTARSDGLVEARLPAGIYLVHVSADDVWEDWIGDEFEEAVFAVCLTESIELRPIRLQRRTGLKPVWYGAFLPSGWVPCPPPRGVEPPNRGGRLVSLYVIARAGGRSTLVFTRFWRLISLEGGERELIGMLKEGERELRVLMNTLLERLAWKREEEPDKEWFMDPDSIRPALLPPGIYLAEVSPTEGKFHSALFTVCLTEDMVLDIRLERGKGTLRLGAFYPHYIFMQPVRLIIDKTRSTETSEGG